MAKITIDKKEYEQLVKDSKALAVLKTAGVCDWEGYYFVKEMEEMEEDDYNEMKLDEEDSNE